MADEKKTMTTPTAPTLDALRQRHHELTEAKRKIEHEAEQVQHQITALEAERRKVAEQVRTMPISANPDATVEFHLRADESKPESERAVFELRYLTRRQLRAFNELVRKAEETTDDDECYRLLLEALKKLVVGWRNLFSPAEEGRPAEPIPSGEFERLEEALSDAEFFELAHRGPLRVQLGELEKKAFTSPSPTAGDRSAEVAANPAAASS